MKPQHSLRAYLIFSFLCCLVLIFAIRIGTRQFIELPDRLAQEYAGDVNAVRQVERSLEAELSRFEAMAGDSGHWSDAYEFMNMQKGGRDFREFVAKEHGFSWSMHIVPKVYGYLYFRPDGERFFESSHDLITGETDVSLPLSLESFPEPALDSYLAVESGLIDSSIGPILFAITGITDDEGTLAPSGYLLLWRKADAQLFDPIFSVLGIEYEVNPARLRSDLVETVRSYEERVVPRDETGNIEWLIDDANGAPLFAVRQETPPRTFPVGVITQSNVVTFIAAALLMLLFSYLVSRRVIDPAIELSTFVREVTADEDFSQRLTFRRDDELGVIAGHFNQLLTRVERQEATLRTQNARLEELADRDSLTGLSNRRVFDRTLDRDWSLAMRSGKPLSCIMVDVDCFKSYNDHYGHQAGDETLTVIARSLGKSMRRATDCVCRYGGEEFIALLMNTGNAEAQDLAERVASDIEALALVHQYSICANVVTASVGVATITPQRGQVPDELVRRADRALYRAKKNGRNQVTNSGIVALRAG